MPARTAPDAPPQVKALQILLIQVGERSFGVPLSQVRHLTAMPAGFSSSGAKAADHFVFEGEPLSYFPLWDFLGLPSQYAEYEEIQAMLPRRRQDHLDWMSALDESIRSGAAFTKARSPRECAFGKWFYGYQGTDRRLSLLLGRFEQPHAQIHALADRLLGLAEAGQGAEALHTFNAVRDGTLATLLALFDSAQELVVELQRRIAVIVANGDEACALGADSVRDIVEIPGERIRQESRTGAPGRPKATSGLVILDDQSIVPLLDWSAWRAGQNAAPDQSKQASPNS